MWNLFCLCTVTLVQCVSNSTQSHLEPFIQRSIYNNVIKDVQICQIDSILAMDECIHPFIHWLERWHCFSPRVVNDTSWNENMVWTCKQVEAIQNACCSQPHWTIYTSGLNKQTLLRMHYSNCLHRVQQGQHVRSFFITTLPF